MVCKYLTYCNGDGRKEGLSELALCHICTSGINRINRAGLLCSYGLMLKELWKGPLRLTNWTADQGGKMAKAKAAEAKISLVLSSVNLLRGRLLHFPECNQQLFHLFLPFS